MIAVVILIFCIAGVYAVAKALDETSSPPARRRGRQRYVGSSAAYAFGRGLGDSTSHCHHDRVETHHYEVVEVPISVEHHHHADAFDDSHESCSTDDSSVGIVESCSVDHDVGGSDGLDFSSDDAGSDFDFSFDDGGSDFDCDSDD